MNNLTFQETRFGYEAQSADNQHTYVIAHNGIDYDLTHYWSQNPQGELLAQVTEAALAPSIAREHYAALGDLTGLKFISPRHANPLYWTVLRLHRNGAWVCEEPAHHTTCEFYASEIAEALKNSPATTR